MNTLKVLWARFRSETPKFWKKAIWLGGVLTVVSAGIMGAPDDIVIPQFIRTVAGYLATAGFILALLAKATTTDNDLSKK